MRHQFVFLCAVLLAVVWSSTAWAMVVIPFEGTVDPGNRQLELSFGHKGGQLVSVNIERSLSNRYHLALNVSHVKTPLFDIAAVVRGDLEFVGSSRKNLELTGELSSQYTLLNYKPVRDLYLKFAVKDRKLVVDDFWLGAVSGKGEINLAGDKRMNVSLEILSADLEDVMALLQQQVGMEPLSLSGVVTGTVNLNGPLARPDFKGRFASYNGHFKSLDYDSIISDFEGKYPLLRLTDGVVTQTQGFSFKVAGVIDLSDLDHLPTQIRLLNKMAITSATGTRREWVFKRLHADEDSATELKYLLNKDDRGDLEGVLGIQKKIDF